MKIRSVHMLWWCLCVFLVMSGCASRSEPDTSASSNTPPQATVPDATSAAAGSETMPPQALRVGVTPDYPPVVFKDQGKVVGLEADLARSMGQELGRRIEFVELPWEALIPALETGQIDVIMSGMSVTEERKRRVRFVDPYMRVGQMAIIREDDLLTLGSPSLLYRTQSRVGFVQDTTGAAFVQENLRHAQGVPLKSVEEGIRALRDVKIDVFVHDAPTVWRVTSSKADRSLVGLFWPLTEEYLAWAVHKTNNVLHAELDAELARWKRTGRLQAILNQWLQVRVEVK